ncbi:site-specific DNA-methyltransferase [Clostridiaceae bacterium DONG20-135]|uniref:Site-specific DNA-methyltransferase n=1 Tax=Copranaerobaculum intestinale TaxID=2692629 RepID=A0A6N8U4P3_9FIRM|nr:DNA methyltransferase [Copranaerobaculum intestinale]MXQ73052.1 site-specific DNA-methyltransferase [Copranaerobaculum intestinale]
MALLQDLIQQIDDPALRDRIMKETDKLVKQKKFGLVFEEHLPECTPLYDMEIHVGSKVAKKTGYVNDIYTVLKIDDDKVICESRETREEATFDIEEMVVVAEFGEPIYPTLKPLDSVENAPDSDLWHTLIEADNYHALQLLEYLYAGKVDCIYIDPPYNNREKDWKYNNDYVDPVDNWRHSKWLSMMQKRLRLAKKILNPSTGVIIVTIDENEVHHLGMLLDEIFPEAVIQMVTIVINPKGNTRGRFSRVEEYAIFCFMPDAYVIPSNDSLLGESEQSKKPRWKGLLRSGADSRREDSKNLFYPILIDAENKKIIKALGALPYPEKPILGEKIEGYEVAWPIRSDLSEGRWMLSTETFNELLQMGYISLGKYDSKRKTWGLSYLSQSLRNQIQNGEIIITERDEVTNTVKVEYASEKSKQIMTVWHRSLHDAGAQGSDMVSTIIGESRAFSFPKSLYSTKDAIASVVRNNKKALIVDFFAGSGTTLNAVNLLNAEDTGSRRCILVTNNETSNEEAVELSTNGFKVGDLEWEKHGIAQSVTWPRTKYTINGFRDDDSELEGEYFTSILTESKKERSVSQIAFIENPLSMTLSEKKQLTALIAKGVIPQSLIKQDTKYIISDNEKHTISILFDDTVADEWIEALQGMDHITSLYIVTKNKKIFSACKKEIKETLGDIVISEPVKLPMKVGFKTNAAFFKLSFLDKTSVALGRQFKELLPVLWMKGNAIGKCPTIESEDIPSMMILPQNKMAILNDEIYYSEFDEELQKHPEIKTIFIVTDSETAYREMIRHYDGKDCYQLYRDYLDNFRINTGR